MSNVMNAAKGGVRKAANESAEQPRPDSWSAYHWREYRIAELLPPAQPGDRVLLLGCGDAGERPYLARLGFETMGLDIHRHPAVDVAGDAHRLPLRDASFDVVLSMQVLEHLRAPWIAVQEVARVLRPGGWFVGSVAFLKPFHDSYFHMTHQGVEQLLASAGLKVDRIAGAQSLTYSVYGGLVPVGTVRFRRAVLGAFDRMLLNLRALAWTVTRRADPDRPTNRFNAGIPLDFRTFDRLRYAPAVVFRARKPLCGDS